MLKKIGFKFMVFNPHDNAIAMFESPGIIGLAPSCSNRMGFQCLRVAQCTFGSRLHWSFQQYCRLVGLGRGLH